MNVDIRELTEDDNDEFNKVFTEVTQKGFPEYSQNILDWFTRDPYREAMHHLRVKFGAFVDGKLVGYTVGSSYDGGVAFVYWLAVLKDFQKQGIGTKLLQAFENFVCDHGYHSLQLNADERNLDYYKKLGYEVIGLDKKSFYGTDNYILKKLLQEPKEENFFKMNLDQ